MVSYANSTPLMDALVPFPPRRLGRFATVVVATDLSPASAGATIEAIALCSALRARLLVLSVIDTHHGIGGQLRPFARAARLDQLRADREQSLLKIVEEARQAGVDAEFLVWTGEPGHSIVAAAEAERADLIVVGTRALDRAGRFLLGSVSDYVVNNSTCPVMIARADAVTQRDKE